VLTGPGKTVQRIDSQIRSSFKQSKGLTNSQANKILRRGTQRRDGKTTQKHSDSRSKVRKCDLLRTFKVMLQCLHTSSSSLVVSVWSLGDFVPFQSEKIVRSLVVVAVATSIIHAVTKWEANKVDLHVQSGLDVVARELRYNTDGARGTQ